MIINSNTFDHLSLSNATYGISFTRMMSHKVCLIAFRNSEFVFIINMKYCIKLKFLYKIFTITWMSKVPRPR